MGQVVTGVAPGFLLFPAREYKWELKDRVQIRVPLAGKISEFLNEADLAEGVKIAGDDEFSIFDGEVFLLWELIRVLFAQSKYPALKDDECLNIVALEKDGDSLVVHGEVIRNAE